MSNIALKWSGIVLVGGALLLGLGIVADALRPPAAAFSSLESGLLLSGAIMLMLALPAMYARQAQAAGALGLAGHVLLETGMLLIVLVAADPLLHPASPEPSQENYVLFVLGLALLFGLLLTAAATWTA